MAIRFETKYPKRLKGGRPRIEAKGKTLMALKPWVKDGMSRATWYRRRKEAEDAER